MSVSPALAQVLMDLSFAAGAAGFVVPLALLLAGVAVPSLILRLTPRPLAWGGLVMPMLWTGSSYGLMGVVNPVLRDRVDWPWFIFSQFVFGVAAAIVVVRTETIAVPPAGRGPTPQDSATARQEETR